MSRAYQLVLAGFATLLLTAACGDREGALARQTDDFEVVTEGQASGVTSTITAPGETPGALIQPPLTDTNVDTTTSFTIVNTGSATTTDTQGTLADTLPSDENRPRPRTSRRSSTPAPRPSAPAPSAPARSDEPPIIDGPDSRVTPTPEPSAPEPEPEQPSEPSTTTDPNR